MKKIILFFAVLFGLLNQCFSQDDTLVRGLCGYHPDVLVDTTGRLNKVGNPTTMSLPKSAYTNTNAIVNCGKFRLYYEDIQSGNNAGFNHPTQGATRRATICAVYQYIQSVFNFNSVPSNDPICIEVQWSSDPASTITACPSSTTQAFKILGTGAPLVLNNSTTGIKNGSLLDHVLTGASPNINQFDATLFINFCASGYSWYENSTGPAGICQFDLFSVALHEVGHQMGFATFLRENASLVPVSTYTAAPNIYSIFDWKYLWHGDITGSPVAMQKFILGTNSLTPTFNAILSTPNTLRDMKVWLTSSITPNHYDNLPIYSGVYHPEYPNYTYSTFPLIAAVKSPLSLGSHICGDMLSFTVRFSKAPGHQKMFVMQPFSAQGRMIRQLTEEEIRIFLNLGYTLNPSYTFSITNRPPYTRKKVTNVMQDPVSTATNVTYPDLVQTPDYTVNCGSSITINLATLPSTVIADPNGDPISIYPGSLHNIRGCGSGGNNHNCLSVNSSSNTITYTPRTNFFGRAQFGFHLYDGKEKGAYMIFTIDVVKTGSFVNTPNINTPIGKPELVLNGDFEEGMEITRYVNTTEEAIIGGGQQNMWEEGRYAQGIMFADAHPLHYIKYNNMPISFGTYIGQSTQNCGTFSPVVGATIFNQYGSAPFAWPSLSTPSCSSGYRYSEIKTQGYNYYSLGTALQKCKYYTLKLDLNNPAQVVGNTYTVGVQFEANYSYPTAIPLQSYVITYTRTTTGWQTVTFPFWYCSTTNANWLNLTVNGSIAVDNVSVTEDTSPPALTVTATASANQVCIGSNTVTLSAISSNSACSASYTWIPGNLTGQTVTVSPTVTTNYTVIMNDGCRTATSSAPGLRIDVGNQTPIPSITASSNQVCIGQTFTLTSSGGAQTSYTWSPGNYTINPVTYTQSATSVYTVSTMLAGCTLGASATYTVNTGPTWTFGSNPSSGLCPGYGTATVTAFGTALSYTWSTGANTNSIVVSPAVTTVYTVSGTDAFGCVSSSTYTVFVNPTCVCKTQSGNIFPTVASNVTLSGGSYAVNSDVIVNGFTTFDQLDLQIAPGVTFSVAPNSTLTIGNCHLYSCFDMWQGIKLSSTSRIIVYNGTLIEDAIEAIKSSNSSLTTGSVISLEDVAFNRNYISITISNYTANIATYPFYIKRCVFTSRQFTSTPTVWPNRVLLSQTVTPANPLGSPYPFQNFPVANLKSPNNSTTAYYGINLNTVGATINPSTTPTYYSIQIGDHTNVGFVNVFDNLFYGIWATDVNLKSMYNVFQNSQYNFIHGTYFGGVGIEHRTEWTEPNNYLLIKAPAPYTLTRNNKFYDCTYGIRANNIFELNASNALIQSTQTASGFYQRGKYGIYCTTDRFKQYDINNSYVYNVENPIVFNSTYGQVNFGASSYTNTQYAGIANINYNTISPVISGAITSQFVSNAITTQNVLSTGSTSTLIAGSQVNVISNVLKSVYRGIYASNFTTPVVTAQANTSTLSLDPTGTLQTGISIIACSNSSVQLNSILGPGTSNTITTGIYASMNTAPKVTCNTVSATYQGFEFSGNNAGAKWKGNSMTNHIRGMNLNNSGVIGTQGSTVSPMDNSWNGTWVINTNFQTWTDNGTFATGSPLYTQSVTPFIMPSLLNSGNPQVQSYFSCCTNTAIGAYSCAGGGARFGNIKSDSVKVYTPTKGTYNSVGLGRVASDDKDYEDAYFKTLEDIAGYKVNKNNVFEPGDFIAQYQLFKVIDNDFSYYQGNKTLNDFYAKNRNSNYGKLVDGENDLKNGNYNSATSALSSISSKNNIESNYNDFYNLYSKYYANTFVDLDNKTLLTLANKCPFTEGEVVYQARALYNIINSTIELFNNNCPSTSSSRLKSTFTLTNNWIVNLYPNPASNELFINTNNEKEDLKITITDVNGRLIADYNSKINGFNGNIKLNMNSGIYFVTLVNQNNDKVVKKLVIAQ